MCGLVCVILPRKTIDASQSNIQELVYHKRFNLPLNSNVKVGGYSSLAVLPHVRLLSLPGQLHVCVTLLKGVFFPKPAGTLQVLFPHRQILTQFCLQTPTGQMGDYLSNIRPN